MTMTDTDKSDGSSFEPVGMAMSGFSLIELLTVIAIVSILAVIGIPSYRYVTYANRVAAEVNALLGDMQLARTEAVKQGQTVTVCPSQGGNVCDNTTNWQNGWIVFVDVNGNQTVDANDTRLRVQTAFAVASDSFASDNNVQAVTFNRDGFAAGLATAAGFVTVTLHTQPQSQQWTRCLQITNLGMMTTQRYGDPPGNCR